MSNRLIIPLPSDCSFDPTWLVEVLQRECPEETAVIEAARRCTSFLIGKSWYVTFISSAQPNQPGAEWQFDRSVVLEDTAYGEVVIDILKDGRIGGIELLDEVIAATCDGRIK